MQIFRENNNINLYNLNYFIKYKISTYYATPMKQELLKELKEIYKFIKWSFERKKQLKLFLRNHIMRYHIKDKLTFNYRENENIVSIEIDINIAINLCINIFNSYRFGNNLLRTDHDSNKYYKKFIEEGKLIDYNKYKIYL